MTTMSDYRPRVLVVEDSPAFRELLLQQLEDLGYDAVGAEDGVYGLAEIARCRPDLVIADIAMPRLEGIGFVERLRANPVTTHLPVLFVTARVDEDSEAFALSVGADGYLGKPFRLDDLARSVAHLCMRDPGEDWIGNGIAVSTMLQVFQLMEHTGVVLVWSRQGVGRLSVVGGELVGASAGEASGEAAAREILGWSDVQVELHEYEDWPTDGSIVTPLADLLASIERPARSPAAGPPGAGAESETREPGPANGLEHEHGRAETTRSAFAWADDSEGDTGRDRPSAAPAAAVVANGTGPSRNGRPASPPRPPVAATAAVSTTNGRAEDTASLREVLAQALAIHGTIGAALIDVERGTTLDQVGAAGLDLDAVAAGSGRVVRAQLAALADREPADDLEVLVSILSSQIHVIWPFGADRAVFLLLVLDKARANLGQALRSLAKLEADSAGARTS
jgi:CheY-like chemotaxis protein